MKCISSLVDLPCKVESSSTAHRQKRSDYSGMYQVCYRLMILAWQTVGKSAGRLLDDVRFFELVGTCELYFSREGRGTRKPRCPRAPSWLAVVSWTPHRAGLIPIWATYN